MTDNDKNEQTETNHAPTLCRDCSHFIDRGTKKGRKNSCQHRRKITHPEIRDLVIAHVDCDAFYAAVEKRDNPALIHKPLIIGGGSNRGVVSTACYIARMNGVRSAMPMYKAKKLCPDAVILPPQMRKYQKVGQQIKDIMRSLTPQVEPLSIDEAFMDFSGTERLHGRPAAIILSEMANHIEEEIGVSVSIGLAPNKFLAKLASDMNKPRGFTIIGESDKREILAEMPISRIYGVGKKTAASLARDGLSMISQLQTMDESTLAKRYGEIGLRLYYLSRGEDRRRINSKRKSKSISSERTLSRDLIDKDALEKILWKLCENVSLELKEKKMAGQTVTLKLKTSMHRIITRSRTVDTPTQLAVTIFEIGQDLLAPLLNGTPYRLIGIGISHFGKLAEADAPDLLEPDRTRKADVERAMDALRSRFGKETIKKGRVIDPAKPADQGKN